MESQAPGPSVDDGNSCHRAAAVRVDETDTNQTDGVTARTAAESSNGAALERNDSRSSREIEEHYRSLFDNLLNGIAHCRMIFSEGQAKDFVFLSVNRAFEKLTGMKGVVGQRACAVLPGLQASNPEMLEIYGRVSATGESERFESYVGPLDMWFSIFAYSPANGEFIAVFDVITEQKRAAAALRANEQRYLLQRQALVGLTAGNVHVDGDLRAAMSRITEVDAKTMGVARVSVWRYNSDRTAIECLDLYELDPGRHTSGLTLSVAEYPAYFRALAAGDFIGVEDPHRDPRTCEFSANYLRPLGITAMLDATIHLAGAVDGVVCHEHIGPPRAWKADEESFATAIANVAALAIEQWQRHEAQVALRTSEERYRLLFEHAPDGIFAVSTTGRVSSLNRAFETITGRPVMEMLGRPFQDFVHPEDRDHAAGFLCAALRGDRVPPVELRVQTAAGDYRNVEFTGFQSRLSGGDVEVQGIGRDVTERNAAQRRLREQNEILSRSHEGVMIVNLKNEISFWNRGVEEIFGWTAAEATGRAPEEMLGVRDASVVAELRAAVDRDGLWNGELHAESRDGRKLIIDSRITMVSDEAGKPRARLTFLTDITEKKLLEEKFLHVQRLESIGMLAAGIAHDLNNVLAPIMFSGPLLRESLFHPRDLKIIETLEQSAERGAGLVKQILGFVRNTVGELQPIQVKHLARDVISIIEQTFPKRIQVDFHVATNLSPVLGNPTQIHQILLNLCINARDAMPEGGILRLKAFNREIDAATAQAIPDGRPGKWLALEIGDNGVGIRPEILELIWTPFFTTKGPGKGTGLGLSTVRAIVARHKGFIELETEAGRGTMFRVNLPVAESATDSGPSVRTDHLPTGAGELILVVDDDAAIRDMVTRIVCQHGYEAVGCANGLEAQTVFRARRDEISLVITDLDMPVLGGVALARSLLEIRPDLRILAISGISGDAIEGEGIPEIKRLAHGFLLKPFKREELLRLLHELLNPLAAPAAPQPSILLIEDDDLFRDTLASALVDRGYMVFQAADGQEGMKLFRAEPTDIVITDMVMPNQDGTEVIAELRHEFRHAGIIAMSGGKAQNPPLYLKVARALGATRTLRKPFSPDVLVQAINEVFAERMMSRKTKQNNTLEAATKFGPYQ